MTGLPDSIPANEVRILTVRNSDKVYAFDLNRNRKVLPKGEYKFIYIPNPHNLKFQALHLFEFEGGVWYVGQHFLDNLNTAFWHIDRPKFV